MASVLGSTGRTSDTDHTGNMDHTTDRERGTRRANKSLLVLLGFAHAFNDMNLGAPAVLLPFFVSERHFSYSTASGLVMALGLTASLWQPLMGIVIDRHPILWTCPLGLLVAGTGIALAGVVRDYAAAFACIALSGFGSASFHPAAARLAGQYSGEGRSAGMGIFSVGGNLGIAVSPVVLTPLLIAFGLRGSSFMIWPAVAMAVGLVVMFKRMSVCLVPSSGYGSTASGTDRWDPFARLTALLIFRAIATQGAINFMPLYVTGILHGTKQQAGVALSVFMLSGALGVLLGGPLSDRYGRRLVVTLSMALVTPMGLLFLAQTNTAFAMAASIPMGLALFSPFSTIVVLGQEYLPNHVGLASGVTLGASSSAGMLVAPLFGWIADVFGLRSSMTAILILPIIVTLLAITLPRDGREALSVHRA